MPDKKSSSAVALAIAMLAAGCAGDTPEARLRETLAAMEQAVEDRRPGDFVEHVSESFSGEGGQLDRQRLRGVLASQMLGAETIEVLLGSPEIRLHGDRATVEVTATVIGGRFLPERGERLQIRSGWRLEDGEWRCISADWTRAGG